MAEAEVDLLPAYMSCQSLLFSPTVDGRLRGQGSSMRGVDLDPVFTLGTVDTLVTGLFRTAGLIPYFLCHWEKIKKSLWPLQTALQGE